VREEIFSLTIRENLRLMAGYGLQLIVIISGHAAENQLAALQRIAADFNAHHHTQVIVTLPFVTNEMGIMEVGHASRIETSVMMALLPETVNLDDLPDINEPMANPDWGIIDYFTFAGQPTDERNIHPADDPRRATAEAGEKMLGRATEQILLRVSEALAKNKKE
jgi:creatinine amidohydrolase